MLMRGDRDPPPPEPQVITREAPRAPTTQVLVAAVDLPMGRTIAEPDLRWQDWPPMPFRQALLTRTDDTRIADDIRGLQIARSQILAGEPIRRERLIRSDGGGFHVGDPSRRQARGGDLD